MAELAAITKGMDFHLEQVQDFTPTPMTVSTEIYYSGVHPYTGERVYTAVTPDQKLAQRQFFFWYKPEDRPSILAELRKMHREDLIRALYPNPALRNSAKPKTDYGSRNRYDQRTKKKYKPK